MGELPWDEDHDRQARDAFMRGEISYKQYNKERRDYHRPAGWKVPDLTKPYKDWVDYNDTYAYWLAEHGDDAIGFASKHGYHLGKPKRPKGYILTTKKRFVRTYLRRYPFTNLGIKFKHKFRMEHKEDPFNPQAEYPFPGGLNPYEPAPKRPKLRRRVIGGPRKFEGQVEDMPWKRPKPARGQKRPGDPDWEDGRPRPVRGDPQDHEAKYDEDYNPIDYPAFWEHDEMSFNPAVATEVLEHFSREKKYIDTDISNATVSSSLEVLADILTVPQGTGASHRAGRKITVTDIYLRGIPFVSSQSDPDAGWDCIRLALVLDRQCNGALPSATTLLATDSLLSYRNVENFHRFKFLMDEHMMVNCQAATATALSAGVDRMWKKHIKCHIPIEYSSSTGVLAERSCCNISLYMISRNGTGGFTPAICRVRYHG